MGDEEHKQRGIEFIARHAGFSDSDFVLIGRILSLDRHPEIQAVRTTRSHSGEPNLAHYEVLVGDIPLEQIEAILIREGFPPLDQARFGHGIASTYSFPREARPGTTIDVHVKPYRPSNYGKKHSDSSFAAED